MDENYTFSDFVRDEYGPFPTDDALEDFLYERDEELREAYDTWCRDQDQ